MSHFNVAVIMPHPMNTTVEALMAPYDENGEWFAEGSRWDWYMVGGRWDGAILGLEPLKITERCIHCNGTGTRPDGLEKFGPEWVKSTNGCNGCQGTGQSEVWPTDNRFSDLERNGCFVKEMAPDYEPYAFVLPTGEWIEKSRMGWFGTEIPDEDGAEKQHKIGEFDQKWAEVKKTMGHHLVISLDCHV